MMDRHQMRRDPKWGKLIQATESLIHGFVDKMALRVHGYYPTEDAYIAITDEVINTVWVDLHNGRRSSITDLYVRWLVSRQVQLLGPDLLRTA